MKCSVDPSVHRQRELELIAHVRGLLDDPRLRVDTAQGRRPVSSLLRDINQSDHSVELKRLMGESGMPDRELEGKMPIGQMLDVLLAKRKLLLLRQPVGRLKVICVSPTRALLKGEPPRPMETGDIHKVLGEIPPPLKGAPTTLVLMSTSGFTLEAHEIAERRADRTLILVEPNDAGGWNVYGPPETRALSELFDPEGEEPKRQRIRQDIESHRDELTGGGVAADKVAGRTQLPIQLIDAELKSYAGNHAGLIARRLDGRMVLFREGTAAPPVDSTGGSDMPFLERIRTLFSRKGETEKKIALLSERRAALSQQRDRSYEDLSALEAKESELRQQFKDARAPLTKRRVTSQLLQLQKEMERRQQMLGVFNQQIDVVSTHLHNLELVRQGQSAKLPDSEELTDDAVKAEEMLAQLQADTELAGTVAQSATAGLSAEEQALYDELERESSQPASPQANSTPAQSTPAQRSAPVATPPAAAATKRPASSEPEAG
jgi:hypothetical protein